MDRVAEQRDSEAGPIRCLGCGYVLIGLPAGRCPECGRRFDKRHDDHL